MKAGFVSARRVATFTFFSICLSALSACNLAPTYKRPEAPVPKSIASSSRAKKNCEKKDSCNIPSVPWRSVIENPALRKIIVRAIKNNRNLRATIANVQAVHGMYRIQRDERLPTVSLGADGTVGQSGLGNDTILNIRNYRVDLGIGAFELDLFGRVKNLSRAALETYLASAAAARSARIGLIAETATTYASLAASTELLTVANDTVENAKDSLRIAENLNRVGLASKVDVFQALGVVAQAESDAAEFETDVARHRNALAVLVGEPLKTTDLPTSLNQLAARVKEIPLDISSEVLLLRPDVAQAEHSLRAAYANIGAARAAFFPPISLSAAVGLVQNSLTRQPAGGFWNVSPVGAIPIFGTGTKGRLAQTKAQQKMLIARYELAVQNAFREVSDAMVRAKTVKRQMAAQLKLVEASKQAYDIAQTRYKSGIDSYLAALTAQRTYYLAQRSEVAARLLEVSNRIALYRVIGNDPSLGPLEFSD